MPATAERDLRPVYRLVIDVCQRGHDAAAWTDRLMGGLAELFLAKVVALAWATLPDRPGAFNRSEVQLHYGLTPEQERRFVQAYRGDDDTFRSEFLRRVVNIPARFVTVRRQDLMTDEEWYAQPEVEAVHRSCGIDANMASFFVLTDRARMFGIGVHRAWGAPQFTVGDRRRLRVLHVELARAWRERFTVPRDADPEIAGLPGRLRQVLWLLCVGRSEKEIARQLRLSPHTVHHHVARLHKLLAVRSRGELLARALTRPGPLPPLALPGPAMNRFKAW